MILNTNFNLNSNIPLDQRNSVKFKTDLDFFDIKSIDNGHIVFCEEDKSYYVWEVTIAEDSITGKFTPLELLLSKLIDDTKITTTSTYSSEKINSLLSGYSELDHTHSIENITDLSNNFYDKSEIDKSLEDLKNSLSWKNPVLDETTLETLDGTAGDALVVNNTDIFIHNGASWINCTKRNLESAKNVDMSSASQGSFLMLQINEDGAFSWIPQSITLSNFTDFAYEDAKQGEILVYDTSKNAFVNQNNIQIVESATNLVDLKNSNDTKLVFVKSEKAFYYYSIVSNNWSPLDLSPIVASETEPINPKNNQLWLNTSDNSLQFYNSTISAFEKVNDMQDSYKKTLQRMLQQLTLYGLNLKDKNDKWYTISVSDTGKLQITKLDVDPVFPDLDDGTSIGTPSTDYYLTNTDLTAALANYYTKSQEDEKFVAKSLIANSNNTIICTSNANYTGADIECKIINGICYLNLKITCNLASQTQIELAKVQNTSLVRYKTSLNSEIETNGLNVILPIGVEIYEGKLLINGGESTKVYSGTISYPV